MKSKSIRDTVLFCMIGALILGAMFFLADRWEGNLPGYSVLNKGPQGFSVYREALGTLGLEVGRVNGPVAEQPIGAIQIVAYAWWFDTTDPAVLQWVRSGGTLVLTALNLPESVDDGTLYYEENGIKIWEVGSGRIITFPAASLTNRALGKDTASSWILTERLMALGDRPVNFNETLLFPQNDGPSLWQASPLWVKLGIYQLLLLAGAWFWMKGSRLGTPLPFEAEAERTELEYLNAAAHFYRAAGCWSLMLGAYHRSLLRLVNAKEDDWIAVWKREGFPEIHRAEALHRWMTDMPPGCTAKEIQQQIQAIEFLKDVVKNRRRAHGAL